MQEALSVHKSDLDNEILDFQLESDAKDWKILGEEELYFACKKDVNC